MSEDRKRYLSFLMRLWQARSGNELVWRASLEDVHSGTRHAFADLAGLLAFLQSELVPGPGSEQLPPNHPLPEHPEGVSE